MSIANPEEEEKEEKEEAEKEEEKPPKTLGELLWKLLQGRKEQKREKLITDVLAE